jgi:hypothetical protein
LKLSSASIMIVIGIPVLRLRQSGIWSYNWDFFVFMPYSFKLAGIPAARWPSHIQGSDMEERDFSSEIISFTRMRVIIFYHSAVQKRPAQTISRQGIYLRDSANPSVERNPLAEGLRSFRIPAFPAWTTAPFQRLRMWIPVPKSKHQLRAKVEFPWSHAPFPSPSPFA